MESEARHRMLSTWLIVVALFLLIMSIKSRAWVVFDGNSYGHFQIGLWSGEVCDDDDCSKIEGSDAEDAPRTGGLGIITLLFGLATGAALIYQALDGRVRVAAYLALGSIAVATFMVFDKEAAHAGPAYMLFMFASMAALIASSLRPAPPTPLQVAEAKAGGSFMQPPPAPPPEP